MPLTSNADQIDTDGDNEGDGCDSDDDGDGVPDAYDCAPFAKKNNKCLVCHNGNTLCIAQSAVQAHLAHGDDLGTCGLGSVARQMNPVEGRFCTARKAHFD